MLSCCRRDIVIKLHRVDEYYPGLNVNDTSIHVGPHEERKQEGIQKCDTGAVVLEKKHHPKCALHGESARSVKESVKLEPTGTCGPPVTPRTDLKYVDKYEIDSKLNTNYIAADCKPAATDEWSCTLSIKSESHRLSDGYSKVSSQHVITDGDGHVGADTIKKIPESLEDVIGKFTYHKKFNRKTRIADSTSEYLSEVEGGIGEIPAKNEDSALSTNTRKY